MAFVYWIRHKDHTDILTEGYVGITNRSVSYRLKEHYRAVRSIDVPNENVNISIVHKAMHKYKDDIIVDTVCECDHDYALWLENKIRPLPNIGWNLSVGGMTGMLGRQQTDTQKMIVSKMWRGCERSEPEADRLRHLCIDREVPEDEKKKRSEVVLNKHLLDLPRTNLDVLSRINDIYKYYLEGYRQYKVASLLNIPHSRGMRGIFNRLDLGYNPLEDDRMQQFILEYVKYNGVYTSDLKTYQEKLIDKQPKNISFDKRGNVLAYFMVDYKRYSKTFNTSRYSLETAMNMARDWLNENMPKGPE